MKTVQTEIECKQKVLREHALKQNYTNNYKIRKKISLQLISAEYLQAGQNVNMKCMMENHSQR